MKPRVLVIGLDCASPELVFDRFPGSLPTLTALRQKGTWGALRSCHPPITVPAWSVMLSGRDPGELGIYGFRNRKDYSYDRLSIATSLDVKVPRIWDHLTGPGDYSIVVGVPGTWPPPEIRGDLVSGFLAPGTDSDTRWTYPPELVSEIEEVVGEYMLDVRDFRTEERNRLIAGITEMTKKRFTLFRHLLSTRPWNFAIMVEIGLDRMHHAFWRTVDPGHRFHDPDSPYREVIRDYYRLLDEEIGETLAEIGFDPHDSRSRSDDTSDTSVFVVSDHGARSLEGGFALNDWLIREGYLVLREDAFPSINLERIDLTPEMIDWSRSRAWGEGGYFGRINLNTAGREPDGIVAPRDLDGLMNELTGKLEALPDDTGQLMGTRAYTSRELFPGGAGIPPDISVYFGDLAWRSIGSITPPTAAVTPDPHDPVRPASLYLPGNDTGPDDANHHWDGISIEAGDRHDGRGEVSRDLSDIAPRILSALDRS